jgi:hypothetical protein
VITCPVLEILPEICNFDLPYLSNLMSQSKERKDFVEKQADLKESSGVPWGVIILVAIVALVVLAFYLDVGELIGV